MRYPSRLAFRVSDALPSSSPFQRGTTEGKESTEFPRTVLHLAIGPDIEGWSFPQAISRHSSKAATLSTSHPMNRSSQLVVKSLVKCLPFGWTDVSDWLEVFDLVLQCAAN